jgi:hypothetical protein
MSKCESKVLAALRKGMRVTRKTAIERGWCENLTATISKLRQKGFLIETIKAQLPEGGSYTRYRLHETAGS